jgi:hypothetical protein
VSLPATYWCGRGNHWKGEESFGRNGDGRRRAWCKGCAADYQHTYRRGRKRNEHDSNATASPARSGPARAD